MAIKSSPFGGTHLTGDDARAFREQAFGKSSSVFDMEQRECRLCKYRISEAQWEQARYDYPCPRCGKDMKHAGRLSDYHPVRETDA